MALGIKCFGKVQGVFFRASTKNEAEKLGVTGWVRNEPDGSVLIHAEGSDGAIEKLLEWSKKGPEFARVTQVEAWEEPEENLNSFEIRQH